MCSPLPGDVPRTGYACSSCWPRHLNKPWMPCMWLQAVCRKWKEVAGDPRVRVVIMHAQQRLAVLPTCSIVMAGVYSRQPYHPHCMQGCYNNTQHKPRHSGALTSLCWEDEDLQTTTTLHCPTTLLSVWPPGAARGVCEALAAAGVRGLPPAGQLLRGKQAATWSGPSWANCRGGWG